MLCSKADGNISGNKLIIDIFIGYYYLINKKILDNRILLSHKAPTFAEATVGRPIPFST